MTRVTFSFKSARFFFRNGSNSFSASPSAARVNVSSVISSPSNQRSVCPICKGAGYLRIAAAPYNTADDYHRLAGAVREVLAGVSQRGP